LGLFSQSPNPSGAPWPVDVLTLEYLISGQVSPDAQKWGWSYFQLLEKGPARTFDVDVTAVKPTGARSAPALAGRRASFARGTAWVGLISRGEAADAVWEEWNGKWAGTPADVLLGPYALSGTVVSTDGAVPTAMLNDCFAVRDATITRVDGAGDGAAITAPRAVFMSAFVHTAAPSPPLA
jgi:hypothetical protein